MNAPAVRLERWIDLPRMGWYSGDHHVHAAGCLHYESPTEGVLPQDMIRHILGEGLNIGAILTWGPAYYYQKQFFEGTRSQAVGSRSPDALRRRGVRLPVEPCGSSRAAAAEGSGLSQHEGARGLADVESADSAVGEVAGRGRGLRAYRLGTGAHLQQPRRSAFEGSAEVRRHRRQRIHRRRHARRGGFPLDGRHAVDVGIEHLVSHAERGLPHAHQRRNRLPVHLRRSRRPRPQLRAAWRDAVVRHVGGRAPRRTRILDRRQEPSDRLQGERRDDGRERKRAAAGQGVDGEGDGARRGAARRRDGESRRSRD